jgi:hypothetical protein
VTQKTTDVLIECAYFDPVTIRKGAKKLDLSSEASRRFERGADYDDVTAVLDRTAQLITQIAGGEILDNIPNGWYVTNAKFGIAENGSVWVEEYNKKLFLSEYVAIKMPKKFFLQCKKLWI